MYEWIADSMSDIRLMMVLQELDVKYWKDKRSAKSLHDFLFNIYSFPFFCRVSYLYDSWERGRYWMILQRIKKENENNTEQKNCSAKLRNRLLNYQFHT